LSPRLIRPKKASSVRRSRELCEFLDCCEDEWLRNKVQEAEASLKENRELGVKIPKDLWPKQYVRKWGIRNLFKCDLGPDWRMTYTLVLNGAGIAVLELEVLPHKEYDRRFGYRTT